VDFSPGSVSWAFFCYNRRLSQFAHGKSDVPTVHLNCEPANISGAKGIM